MQAKIVPSRPRGKLKKFHRKYLINVRIFMYIHTYIYIIVYAFLWSKEAQSSSNCLQRLKVQCTST